MKIRIATLMMVIGLFVASNTFAYPPFPAPKAVAVSIANYISDKIDYPEFAVKEKLECTVVVKLTVQEDGRFAVDAANSIDIRMRKHVIAAIHALNEKADYYSQFAGMEVNLKLEFDLKLV
jgi:hypothetical protein